MTGRPAHAAGRPAPRARPALLGLLLAMMALACGSAGAQQARLLGQYGSWSAFRSLPPNEPRCFAVAAPQPPPGGAPGRTAFFFVSTWPQDRISEEVSVNLGYVARRLAGAEVRVDDRRFPLFVAADRAFVDISTAEGVRQEDALVAALRAGRRLEVAATTLSGSAVRDVYLLDGARAAIDRANAACPF